MTLYPHHLRCCLCGSRCDAEDPSGTTIHLMGEGTRATPWVCLACAASNPADVCCDGLEGFPDLRGEG